MDEKPLAVEVPDNPHDPNAPPTDARETAVMAWPPHLDENLAIREEHPELRRVITPAQQAQLNTPPPRASSAPQVNSRQFGAVVVAPNEFKITHQGKDLGGKVLTPTEVPVVLGWLNSLPPD